MQLNPKHLGKCQQWGRIGGLLFIITSILRVIKIVGTHNVRRRVIVAGLRADRARGAVVGGQARRQPLPMRHVDLEALPVHALLPIVVAWEEVRGPDLQERHRHGNGACGGVGGVRRRPLDGVIVEGVVVVAELVRCEVVCLDHRVVGVRVEN